MTKEKDTKYTFLINQNKVDSSHISDETYPSTWNDLIHLVQISDTALSTIDLNDLLNSLLKCLIDITCADAAVILLNESNTLSMYLRMAVDNYTRQGYSLPINQGFAGKIAQTRQPAYVSNAQTDPIVINPLIKEQGIVSMLGVPMIHNGDLIGVLHIDWLNHHPQDEKELWILEMAADRSATAIVNAILHERVKKAESALRESDDRLRSAIQRLGSHIENSPLAVIEWSNDYKVTRWSSEAVRVFGWSADEMLGKRIDEVQLVHEEDWDGLKKLMADMNAGIHPKNMNPNRNYRKDGTVIYCQWYNSALKDESGNIDSVMSLVLNVTEREHALEELARARTEAEQRAAELESFMTSIADGIVVFDSKEKILLANEALKKLTGATVNISWQDWVKQSKLYTLDDKLVSAEYSPVRLVLSGEDIQDARFIMVTPWRRFTVSINGSPIKSAEDEIIGGTLTYRDISSIVEFERQREELFQRERHISDVLQQSLVPSELTSNSRNLKIAAIYKAALNEAEIGGDFYDVFDIDDEKIGILIGDIAGKGLGAAIHVSAVRHAIRNYAYIEPQPSRVMSLANNAICRESNGGMTMLTAVFAIIDTKSKSVTYANAGHLPPIICRKNGNVEELSFGDIPLGIMQNVDYESINYDYMPSDTLILLTDGITEARKSGSVLYGKERMMNYLIQNQMRSPDGVILGLLQEAITHACGQLQDDAAILAIRFES